MRHLPLDYWKKIIFSDETQVVTVKNKSFVFGENLVRIIKRRPECLAVLCTTYNNTSTTQNNGNTYNPKLNKTLHFDTATPIYNIQRQQYNALLQFTMHSDYHLLLQIFMCAWRSVFSYSDQCPYEMTPSHAMHEHLCDSGQLMHTPVCRVHGIIVLYRAYTSHTQNNCYTCMFICMYM